MKRILLACASALIALVLPGCLQSETTIHLNKDGSGTLVEQTTLGAQMLAMLNQMGSIGGGGAKDPLADMFSMEKAKARAATLGEGVTVEKSVPYESGGNKGATVVYHFTDINKLTISPGDNMKNLSPMGAHVPASAAKMKPIHFAYADGTLTLTMPEPEKSAADAPKPPHAPDMPDMENPQMEAMMKQMLGDMKVSFKLVADSGIAETDATFHTDNTVTLMEMEMGKLLEKPDAFKKLSKAPKNDPAAAMELMKTLDGVKVETKKQITVKVK